MWPQYTLPPQTPRRHRFSNGKQDTVYERFWRKVIVTETCWLWKNAKNNKGYGRLSDGVSVQCSHRIAWAMFRGSIPANIMVLHGCDTPLCVNPNHLFLGTQLDNVRDMMNKGRSNFWPGHHGERHVRAKLTDAAAREIVEQIAAGIATRKELAVRWGVSYATVCHLLQGRSWHHQTGLPHVK